MYFEPENPDDPLPISEDEMSGNEEEEDDEDMPHSDSSEQITGMLYAEIKRNWTLECA